MRAIPCATLVCLAAGVYLTAAALFGAEQTTPEYDATFLGMTIPERVKADEAFAVTVTMRNTGSKPWQGADFRLRSVDSKSNALWGTGYILIAQGTVVQPGKEYSFRSHLKAPRATGLANFQWQVCKSGTNWLGQTTPRRVIEVLSRTHQPEQPAADILPKAGTKLVLKYADFEYAGSFKPPKIVSGARGAFSEAGLALRPGPNGQPRLLVNYTHPTQVLFEIDIPPLVKIDSERHVGLNTAEIRRIWGALKLTSPGEETIFPNGGFVWMEKTGTLFWTWYHGYKTGEAPPILGATRLSEDGQATSFGPWRILAPGGLYKSYWGGVIALPTGFAGQYTDDGKALALGFGGYYSICGPASRGPALGVIPEPDSQKALVPVTPLLYHPHNSPALRDGDYFNANCGFWSEQPRDPAHGTWSYDDWCRAGVFIETPAAEAFIAFVRLGTGRLGYDYGTITSAGSAEYWYFYNPQALGDAAAGRRQPWEINPASMAQVNYPLGRTVTGACFDSKAHLLYLCVSWAYPDGKENYPIIHVFRIKQG